MRGEIVPTIDQDTILATIHQQKSETVRALKSLSERAEHAPFGQVRDWFFITELHLAAYLRYTSRYFVFNEHPYSGRYPTIDISSVEVDENFRGKGNFGEFIKEIEEVASMEHRIVFVESVLNVDLVDYLRRIGYKTMPDYYNNSPNLYKMVSNETSTC